MRFFFPIFFPAYSVIAKISARLHLSWLYLIYLTAKSISFLHEKLNPRKFSSLPTCGFLAQLVAAPSEYLQAWVRIPSKAESFSINFSLIGKIATHLLGSLLNFNPQVERNLSFVFDNKMVANVLSYALKKHLKYNEQNITV